MIMYTEIAQKLREIVGDDGVMLAEGMDRHTTIAAGGPADVFVLPRTPKEMEGVMRTVRDHRCEHFILGNGSDLLVSDRGYRGVVICARALDRIEVAGHDRIEAGAGVLLADLCRAAARQGLSGAEFACGIPGSVGGAIFMNAGAYGGEIKDILTEACVLEEDGRLHWVEAKELAFGYRHSNIAEKGRVVVAGRFLLKPGDRRRIEADMEEYDRRRQEKQPLDYPSAGSTFKRPEGYFAGKLIADAGLRGYQRGGARVSEKHCGFVINADHASSADIYGLIQEVRKKVKETSGVDLYPEVRMLGEFT